MAGEGVVDALTRRTSGRFGMDGRCEEDLKEIAGMSSMSGFQEGGDVCGSSSSALCSALFVNSFRSRWREIAV